MKERGFQDRDPTEARPNGDG